MTFCGIIYTGGTIALLGYMGSKAATGVPLLSVVAFSLFVIALLSFAIFYQKHSQLMAARNYHYAATAHKFFTRAASFTDLIEAGQVLTAKRLYKVIFWVPLTLMCCGFVFGILGIVGVGPLITPSR